MRCFLFILVNCFFLGPLAQAASEILTSEDFLESARQHEMDAEQSLGKETVENHESADDFRLALHLYREAAKLGNRVAKCRLGRFYQMNHPGIPRNDSEALYWLIEAGDYGKKSLEDLLARLNLKQALSHLLPMLKEKRIDPKLLMESLLQAKQLDLWRQIQGHLDLMNARTALSSPAFDT